ncbi:MAG: holo-ACP synthase [Burkholderiales bacterium]|nr:holo-ACP synthase [Burkholderiales bacterium]
MIVGFGSDLVEIARVRRILARHGRFAGRVLAEAEMAAFAAMRDGAAYVAKRFAAKEAFYKAFGEPPGRANTWHQLAVLNDASGRPRLDFGPGLAALLADRGIDRWHVTLSDEREYALACVILESTHP